MAYLVEPPNLPLLLHGCLPHKIRHWEHTAKPDVTAAVDNIVARPGELKATRSNKAEFVMCDQAISVTHIPCWT